jgi:hypothetical protein
MIGETKTLEAKTENTGAESKLVDAPQLLEAVFAPECRPTVRWLRSQVASRSLPFCRVGRLVFFDPVQVRNHMVAKAARGCRSRGGVQ